MSDRICLITGPTSGIGKATARVLANQGHKLVLVARHQGKLDETRRMLRRHAGGGDYGSFLCDLSVMADVRAAVERIKEAYDRIDVLINNAGARFLRHQLTREGFERTLATNHLGPFLLTLGLIDRLMRSTSPRIINISSGVHYAGSGVIENILSPINFDGRRQYANAKLANILFTYDLAERLRGRGVTVNAVGPGGVATNFARNNGWVPWIKHRAYYLFRGRLRTPRQAAETPAYLASACEVADVTGAYFVDKRPARTSEISYDRELQIKLWAMSVAWSGVDLRFREPA
jgi:retinol dehydrogenase-12